MSTEVLEAPPVVTEPPKVTPPAPNPAELVKSFLKPTVKPAGDAAPINPPVAKVDPPKVDAKPPEAEKPKPDAEKNWAELRAAREAAEKLAKEREEELTRVRTEYETFKKNPVPKEFEEKLTAAEKRALEMQERLRAADLAQDPEFQRKYAEPIQSSLELMRDAAVAAGVTPQEVTQAITAWDKSKFAEWLDAMPATEKMDFQAAYVRAVDLDRQRNHELKNASRAWEELSKTRQSEQERQQKLYLDSLRNETKSVLTELADSQEMFKNDPELQRETETLLNRAAGLDGERLPTKQILSNIAQAHVLARHFQRVDKELGESKAELEKLRKDLAERDAFIKGQNLAVPGINPTVVPSTSPGETQAMAAKFLRPIVRV